METIIGNYLVNLFTENDLLTKYLNEPAVFNQKAPDDINDGEESYWQNDKQFPRCIFELNMQADPERKISGRLFVDVMTENNQNEVQAEYLAEIVQRAVDGCFFSSSELTISAQWERSDVFTQNDDKVTGMTLAFDILAYPKQGLDSPDPIHATNLWLKTIYQKAYVIGFDTLPEVWKPTDENPAIYTRLSKLGQSSRMRSTAAVTWLCADIQIHVMTPSDEVRMKMNGAIPHLLIHADKLILDDNSPMLIDSTNVNMGADPQREGQINIKGTYGILPTEEVGEPLRNIYAKGLNLEVHYGEK